MYGLYHPVFRVFTVVSGWSLPSLSIFVYINVFININIIHKYGIYLAISKVSTFPCPLKVNNGCQWLIFSKITKGLYQKVCENNISAQDIAQNISTKHYFEKQIQQILKRHLHPKNLWREISTNAEFNRNLDHKVFNSSISTKIIEGEISTK